MCGFVFRFVVLVLGAIITAVAVTVHASNKQETNSDSTSASSDNTNSAAATTAPSSSEDTSSTTDASDGSKTGGSKSTCPEIAPSERTVVFWQSEVNGCEKVPVGVTHIVWGFALVADGVVVPTFQNSDAYVKSCVQSLRR